MSETWPLCDIYRINVGTLHGDEDNKRLERGQLKTTHDGDGACQPAQCNRRGYSEQLLQDFTQYKEKMELFFTAAQVVGVHTVDPAGRHDKAHTLHVYA